MGRRIIAEALATAAALAVCGLYLQLRDPVSPLRIRLAEWGDRVSDWSIRYRVESLIESTEGS